MRIRAVPERRRGRCDGIGHRLSSRLWPVIALAFLNAGCGGGSGANAPPPPPANTTALSTTLVASQVVGGSAETGTATASLTLDRDDGSLSGTVTLAGVNATGVAIHTGFAGERGPAIVTLQQDNATRWSVPTNAVLTSTDQDALAAGAVYISATTTAQPNGAVRGQLLPADIALLLVPLSDIQEVPLLTSAATAIAAVTLKRSTGAIVVHVNTDGLDDAVAAAVHRALAGVNGPVLIDLEQDPNDVKHWSSSDAVLDAAGLQALDAAELYVNVHTPANPDGEVRGQVVPPTRAVVFAPLGGASVVPPVVINARAVAAVTFDPSLATGEVTVHVNTAGLSDADTAHLHQAPIGANGPELLSLSQDPNDPSHWQSSAAALDVTGMQALNAGETYIDVHTPPQPNGAVRGQMVPPNVTPTSGSFRVASVTPASGANLTSFPSQVVVTFNRQVKASTVTTASVSLKASGGDGSFGDGNETSIAPTSIQSNGTTATIALPSATVANDTFEIRLNGTNGERITDLNGNVLDGDSDNTAGGDFASMFTVTASSTATTFTWIQNNVFTPSCALSGCHAGPTPQQGMNLSLGQAYAAIVGVASHEQPSLLRINPGNPDQSYLQQKIQGTAAVGGRMPLFMTPLPDDSIKAIRDWIAGGAQNN